MNRRWALLIVTAAALSASRLVCAAVAEPRLFGSRPAASNAASAAGPGVVRSRPVRWNAAALPGILGKGGLPPAGQPIVLNLFPGVSRRARLARATRLAKGMTWVGRLDGEPLSDVILTVWDGVLTGSVVWPGGTYRISFDGVGPVVEQLDHGQFPEGNCFEEVPASAGPLVSPNAGALTSADDGSLVDVLVVYTIAARTAAGGTAAMLSLVNTAVAETNTGYANSAVVQRLRLVSAAEIAFTEVTSDIRADLYSIAANASVQAMRNTHRADEVVLIGEGYGTGSGACGIAFLMGGNLPSFEPNAYSVVDRTCATGYFSFGHELGHNMGLNHARVDPVATGAFSYSYGYKNPANLFRTVMAYNCTVNCPRILHFSNPGVLYGGNPTGVSEALPASSANNALSLNGTRVTVANFRVGSVAASVTVPNGGEVWPAGSTWPIRWTASGLSAVATVRLQYTNGSVTNTIASGLSRTATSYNWTVPNTQGSGWRVIVCSLVGASCEAQDQSDAAFSIVPAVATPAARGDLSGDAKPDILWHDQANGALRLWSMNGTLKTAIGALNPGRVSDLQSQVRAVADFNADGKNDLLWQHLGTGGLSLWLMGGASALDGAAPSPGGRSDTAWQVRGAADVNGDGRPDVLWHNQSTGAVQIWTMRNLAQTGATLNVGAVPDTRWAIRGFGDLDGDSEADILWQRQDSGDLALWRLSGGVQVGSALPVPSREPDLEWRLAQMADFDGDGQNDLLWQHVGTRQLVVWFMNGTALSRLAWVLGWQSGAVVSPTKDAGAWQVTPR